MVGLEMTAEEWGPGPALLSTTIAGNALLSMGRKSDAEPLAEFFGKFFE